MKNQRIVIKAFAAFCLLMALFLSPILAFADNNVKVTAALSQSQVAVGNRFQLQFIVNDRGSDIAFPDVNEFQVVMGPSVSQSVSHSIINGQVQSSRETVYTYVLVALKAGTFVIPGATVSVGGNNYTSNSVSIKVVDAGSNAQSQPNNPATQGSSASGASNSQNADLFLRQTLSKSSVSEGEGVLLVTKVYTRVALNSVTDKVSPKLSEFVVADMSPQQYSFHTEFVDGVQYQCSECDRKTIIPQSSGKISIEPAEMEFVVETRGRGFFGLGVQMQSRRIKSNALTLNVKPLPAKPAGFSGGVGSFKFDVSVSPEEVEVDNSVTVKVSVEGDGNLKLLALPKPQFHPDFDVYDPNKKSDINPSDKGYRGKRTDEYLIIPRRDGAFEIPEVKFVYYDLDQAKYVTVSKGPFSINVLPSANGNKGTQGGVVISGSGPETVVYTDRDLRYLHRSKGLMPRNDFFVLSPLFWLLTILPVVALALLFALYRKRIYDNNNIGLVRSRKANKMARKRLKLAAKYIKEDKREAFYDEVMRALWGYLSDKLTLPLSVLTKDNAKERMAEHNVDADASDEFLSLLDECEFARYAPAASSATLDEVYAKAIDVIEKIEDGSKK